MKTLVIAEKPSVAQDIVRALTPVAGKFDKHEEHFENEKYVVTSAVGHLVEIQAPEEFDVKRGKWSFANLPVIPPHFDLKPVDKTKTRLNAVVKQAKRKDVTQLINACDAGREGELIFRLIEQYARRQGAAGQAGQAPVAAVDDAAGHPRRLRPAAQRPADEGPGRRGALALGGRLAGRHQRHARHDRLQFARRRLLPDHRRPRADADAVGGGRARGEDPQVRQPRLLGSARQLPGRGRRVPGQVVRPQAGRSRRPAPTAYPIPSSAPTASGTSRKRRPSPRPRAASPPPSPRRASPPRRPRRCCST